MVLMKVPISFMFNSFRICPNNIIEMTLQEIDCHSKIKIGLWLYDYSNAICALPFKATVFWMPFSVEEGVL